MNFGGLLLSNLLMQKLADYSHINQASGTGLKSENLLLHSSHIQNIPAPPLIHVYYVRPAAVPRNLNPFGWDYIPHWIRKQASILADT